MPVRRIMLAAALALLETSAAFAGCTLGKMAEIPIVMRGRRPETHLAVNGADAVFLVDSGAFYSTITPGTAAELKLKVTPTPPGFLLRGVGGAADAGIATVKELRFAGVPFKDVQFLVGGSETGGAGLLGQNVLRLGDVDYDLREGNVRLMRATDCAKMDLAYWAGKRPYSVLSIEPTTPQQPHTIAAVVVNATKLRALFDTGASESTISTAAATRAGIRLDGPGVQPAGYSHGLGRRMVPVRLAPVAYVKIGGEEIRNTRLEVGDIGGDVDMLIGADFFLSHRVYVANSQHRMYFTYEGGPIFAAARDVRAVDGAGKPLDLPTASADEPKDAAGFAQRGAALAARGEGKDALADLDKAVALAPNDPALLVERARLRARFGQRGPALADLDAALALKPDLPEALVARAAMRLAGVEEDQPAGATPPRRATPEERAAGLADLDAAARTLAPAADLRLTLATMYQSRDRFDAAIAQYDLWIANHPVDSRRPEALNGRCWARALAGTDLQKALADCNAAVRLMPQKGLALDSRGLVRLRMGDAAGAAKDYDAALAINPKIAWSLYGRGLAKLKLGDKAGSDTDLAAATALAPGLPARAKRLGIGV